MNIDEAFLSISEDIVTRLKVNPGHYGSPSDAYGTARVRGEELNKRGNKNDQSACC